MDKKAQNLFDFFFLEEEEEERPDNFPTKPTTAKNGKLEQLSGSQFAALFRKSSEEQRTRTLHLGAEAGNARLVSRLLEAGVDVDSISTVRTFASVDNERAIHCAVLNCQLEVIDILIAAGADLEANRANCRGTPLILAASSTDAGDAESFLLRKTMVERLLQAGASVNAQCDGYTAIMGASSSNRVDLIQVLLAAGAGLEDTYSTRFGFSWRQSALKYAASLGKVEAVLCLLEAGATWQSCISENAWIGYQVTYCSPEVLETLFAAGIDAGAKDFEGKTVLWHAAQTDNADRRNVNRLRSASTGVHFNISEKAEEEERPCPLWKAAILGNVVVVDALLAALDGTDPENVSRYHIPLRAAARVGHVEITAALLRAGADPACGEEQWADQPLFHAVQDRYCHIVRLLIEAGAVLGGKSMITNHYVATFAVLGGFREWAKVPIECAGLESAILLVWRRSPKDLPLLFERLQPAAKERVRTALLCLKRFLPSLEEDHRMEILGQALLPSDEEWRVILAQDNLNINMKNMRKPKYQRGWR